MVERRLVLYGDGVGNHMSYFDRVSVSMADSPSIDAFSRLRVSTPTGLFESQFTYDLNPLIMEAIATGTGATVTHDATNRMALMTFSSTPTGGKAYMQSYDYVRYQPGRSQSIFITFVMGAGVTNVVKFAGYSDGVNGIEFRLSGTTKQFVRLSGTTAGNETVAQANWNLDKLDGTGASGLTLDLTKTQILIIDLQALYVGRVRVGFDIDGVVVYAHQFVHANHIAYPYIANANLPVSCGMTCTGTVSATMNFICCSVSSEGGTDEDYGFTFAQEGTVTASSGARTHILSVRPKTTFNSIANRTKFIPLEVDVLVTGNNPVLWELCLGQAISGTTTYNDVNTSYSAFEYNTAGTISGSPGLVVASGYVGATNQTKGVVATRMARNYPITLDAAGAVRAMGTYSILVTGIGGTSACRATLSWKEQRS